MAIYFYPSPEALRQIKTKTNPRTVSAKFFIYYKMVSFFSPHYVFAEFGERVSCLWKHIIWGEGRNIFEKTVLEN